MSYDEQLNKSIWKYYNAKRQNLKQNMTMFQPKKVKN